MAAPERTGGRILADALRATGPHCAADHTAGAARSFPGIARREAKSHAAANATPNASIHSVGRMPSVSASAAPASAPAGVSRPAGDLPRRRGPAQRVGGQQALPQRRFVDEIDGERAVADHLRRDQESHRDPRHRGSERNQHLRRAADDERADQRPARAPAQRGGPRRARRRRGRPMPPQPIVMPSCAGVRPRSESANSV